MPTYRQRQSQYTEPPCVEMDNRYSLLKDAMVRNIKEYNDKFKARKSWKWTPLFIANPKTVRKCHYRNTKANFPARIAFRVTSKIDSRTILDTSERISWLDAEICFTR
jgi:S-DNA-T family DNA segregation ATPase FtsK/SpoIIIE